MRDVDPADGSWALTWSTAVTNRRAEPLRFGSPTTHGRPDAGYTGLFWRGPRAFVTGGSGTKTRRGPELMGHQSPWPGVPWGDGRDRRARDAGLRPLPRERPHRRGGGHPAHWFVRDSPFAAVAPSLAFHEELVLEPGPRRPAATGVLVADGAWDRERVASRVGAFAW
ncbi:DUF6807 family protein [Streptomyces flavovirens]|uniref:DUF6807 family protein n=1 Tax=Streptomyces flavovirens TaxID=52258 RepID=UPI0031E9477F